MFNNISWSSYITFIVLSAVAYYIVIGIMYFRADAMLLLKGGLKGRMHEQPEVFTSPDQSSVHELMAELNQLFSTAAEQGYPKEELLMALKTKLKEHTHLKNTNLEKALQEHIALSAGSSCGIQLDQSDMNRIW